MNDVVVISKHARELPGDRPLARLALLSRSRVGFVLVERRPVRPLRAEVSEVGLWVVDAHADPSRGPM